MKHKELMEDYRNKSDEQLRKDLKEFSIKMMKAQTMMGMASAQKGEKPQQAKGSDILKRLRKEVARINTIISQRRQEALLSNGRRK